MKRYTEEEINFLKENYPYKGAKYCSDNLNRPLSSIRDKVCVLKLRVSDELKVINIINRVKAHKETKKEFDTYNVNPNVFLNLENKEVCYILGLLWADGYLSKNNGYVYYSIIWLYLVKEDILNIKNVFDSIGIWNYYERTTSNRKQIGINTSNKIICDFLLENDYLNRDATKILNKMSIKFKKYFFRGFFDGDGTVSIKKAKNYIFNITSFYEQEWGFMESLFQELNIKYVISRKIDKNNYRYSRIIVQNKDGLKKFFNYIYSDYDNIGLFRKYLKFKEIDEIVLR